MASLHRDRRGRSPFWYCAYDVTQPDGTRRRIQRSTKVTDKKQAVQICHTWAKASNLSGKLTPDRAREIIAAGVEDVLAASGETLPSATVRNWGQRWLEIKSVEAQTSTHTRYELGLRAFLDFLGAKADRDLNTLTADTVLRFREEGSKTLSVATVNTNLKIVRACLNAAFRQGLVSVNVASRVSCLKESGESKRRALTLAEIQKVLRACDDTPWRGLVLVGLYTGQRLGDCARLTWQQLDLCNEEIWFVTAKTGKRLSMKLAKPLLDYLHSLPSASDPNAFVFARFAQMANTATSSLSSAFAGEVLIPAKLMSPRPVNHGASGAGRTGQRQVNAVTFHSLRHSFVTMMKATGASNALAQMIVGHDSAAVNAHYTHLGADDTADSISKLPDVTQESETPRMLDI